MSIPREIKAEYLIETAYPLRQAAEIMAGEQSSGTFLPVPGESPELKTRYGAVIEVLQDLGPVEHPSLPGAGKPTGRQEVRQARVVLAWPLHNIGINLPMLVSTVAGNLYELAPFSGLRLLDIHLPKVFTEIYPGPRFGIEGTRALTDVFSRPLIGTIIKPSVGLSPDQTAQLTRQLVEGGLDFIKDDELMGDAPHSPFRDRVKLCMDVIKRGADQFGKKVMYAFNISGDIDDMKRRHDWVLEQGGTCIMINLNWVGFSAVAEMARYSQVPIHGHRNGWGMFTRSPALGMEFVAYQKLWRLAGVDHIHTNGIRNKFCESDESVIRSVRACLDPFLDVRSPMPVLSSGQWAEQAPDTYHAVSSTDLMYLCGGGIVAHPGGISAGVRSVIEGWEAAVQGVKLEDYARTHPALAEALDFFSKKRS